uniref:Uncharacterized protein n=1 Tax=Glycine max TaxID=3847 RepID=C6T1R4_SOYBN|nr:unknown [Glycine max]
MPNSNTSIHHCTMNMMNITNSQILYMVERRRRRRMVVLVEKSVPPLEIKKNIILKEW